LVLPRKPFADWANSLDHDGPRFTLDDGDDNLIVFLGPDVETNREARAFVRKNFNIFFETWLFEWCTDRTLWPRHRTREMFKRWFDIRIHSTVEDTVDHPLVRLL